MLTQEQIDGFHRDGFLVMKKLYQGEELEALQKVVDLTTWEAVAGKGNDHLYCEKGDRPKVYYRSEKMLDRDDVYKAVSVNPILLENIGQCIGHPFLPMNDSLVCKLPGGDVPILWHQDPPGNRIEERATFHIPNFVTDIYLDTSTVENGCVWAIPGHHLVGHINMDRFSQEELFDHPDARPIEMEPGDVLFHSTSSPHGSIGNKTEDIRRILYLHFMAEDVYRHCYQEKMSMSRGGYEGMKEYTKKMIEVRKKLNWNGLDDHSIELNENGLEFIGELQTPKFYWGKMIGQMSREEMDVKRKLNYCSY